MTNVSSKWPVLVLVFLATLAAAFTLGRCTGAGSAEEPPGYPSSSYDPLLSLPTTKDSIYVPLPQETVRVELPAVVDTDAIISSYFSRHVYRDTLRASAPGKLGGSAVAVISDTVAQNVIAGRSVRLTFTPNRLATTRSVDLLSTWGLHNTTLLAAYHYRRWVMYAGYNFSERSPVAGVGYQLIRW